MKGTNAELAGVALIEAQSTLRVWGVIHSLCIQSNSIQDRCVAHNHFWHWFARISQSM
jgi:hypothetical protein